ncbi:SphA family protein [Acinetobacter courvalinii]|uniref:Transporter n=1 Tax=Acinetobacter courvalinii TaxID=280147 RepID=A0AA42L752_9GAMM|nr:transporter [Acinetobacter courvalinii]MDH0563738.1 transporter [Acinetobacter courvalinii]
MKKKILSLGLVLIATTSFASDLPTVNLGLSSFVDGAVPAGNGWYAQTYFQNYSADSIRDLNGDKVPLPKSEIDYQSIVQQISYISDIKLGHGNIGLNIVIPLLAHIDVDDGLNNQAIKTNRGLGDIVIGPFIQFEPVLGKDGPKFSQRFEFQINLPTGDYDRHRDINPGANALSIDPYWAATYWINPKWTVSTRLHYLYNFKNNDPNYSFGAADDLQAGQALHGNFESSYAVTPQLRLGINGYWLKQMTDTQVDGENVKGRREQVWAIGPGAMYSFSAHDHLVANAYFEQDAENRPQGSSVIFRYVHHFHK